MSDFISGGWAVFVSVATILSLVFCIVVLVIASKRKPMADDNSTGHIWDEDLKEMNNPLPRWWMWLFVITVVFAAAYLTFYPGLGTNPGTFKWSSAGQWETEQQKAHAAMAPVYDKFKAMPAAELAKDAQALGIGERLFVNNCAQCHGSDARGSKGFPNLADSDWLGGTGPEYIAKTIAAGRQGMMPPMAAAVGTPEDVKNVANYVLSLSGSPHNNVAAQLGKAKYAACAACHGGDGKGNQALGAPNLSDKVWLHGWGEEAIVHIVGAGKTNVMPAFDKRLTPEQIHVLSAYVWNLSQGTAVAVK
ncbi:cytochrome-c oxidase, cbb3-type subunit III [Aquabacterium sp. OR-4]|uniref:cytochrome-c oxidase, cbb3-type subunit III n=1 Tax=Aquabacterium sp. OR-4 TaxID=2978127 RepID=UPI0028C6A063|nr:cytochrome-c oxidase, cbb3-type subunit III [Aquabacterium sp. OR-4]MDT7835310.1 cytochrome-c oxidase, cbb3-type subunit III [Aquabacterium sp. OR-4]